MEICWIILRNKRKITCQRKYSSITIVDVIIPDLYGKNRNKKLILMTTVLNQLFSDQREKLLIRKHIVVSGKKSVCVVDKKHPNWSKDWQKVGTLPFQTSLLNKCHERADKWPEDALRRLSSSIDLVAGIAIYDGQCESRFFTKKYIPTIKETETEHTSGRQIGKARKASFEKLCAWLEEKTELFTVSELMQKCVHLQKKI